MSEDLNRLIYDELIKVNANLEECISLLSKREPVKKKGKKVNQEKKKRGRKGYDGKIAGHVGSTKIYSDVVNVLLKKTSISRKEIINTLMAVCNYKENSANQVASAYVQHIRDLGREVSLGKRGRPKGSGKKRRKKLNTDNGQLTLKTTFNNKKIWKEVLDDLPDVPEKKDVVNSLVKAGYKRTTARNMAPSYLDYLQEEK